MRKAVLSEKEQWLKTLTHQYQMCNLTPSGVA